jgi:hypothetical protein
MRPVEAQGRLPVVVMIGGDAQDASARRLAAEGSLVVLPQVRFTGVYDLSKLSPLSVPLASGAFGRAVSDDPEADWLTPPGAFGPTTPMSMESSWTRNALIWGRPLPGMTCTDLRSTLDAVAARRDADMDNVRIVGRDSAAAAVAALFVAVLDDRVSAVDVDLHDACFANKRLPIVPSVLLHGDVLQWAAVLADRQVSVGGIPPEAGDVRLLSSVFAVVGNADGLKLASP